MDVVRVDGLEIAYEHVGEGPPLVLVHGATVDSRMWQPQLAALTDELTVVALDEPGAGRSSDVLAGFGLECGRELRADTSRAGEEIGATIDERAM